MTFQPGSMMYTQGFGSRPENIEVPFISDRAPTTSDYLFPLGKTWLYVGNSIWQLLNISTSQGVTSATWVEIADSDGPVQEILGTASEIDVTSAAGTYTISLPTSIVAPGSLTTTTTLEATTTVTGGTGVIATTGGVTATAGDITASADNIVATLGNITADAGNIAATLGSVSAGTTVTAGTGMTITTGDLDVSAGDVNVTGNILASKSAAAASITAQITNSDNTDLASNAGVEIAVGGSAGGDPYLSFQVSGVGASTMTMGLDNSASDLFVISNSAAIGTSNALTLSQAGALDATTSITAGTTLTATLGAITATNGNLVLGTAGNKLSIATGANASVGSDTLTNGTVTVMTTAVTASSIIMLTRQTVGTTGANDLGVLSVGTIVAGTSFVINAWSVTDATTLQADDQSVIGWMIIN